MSDISDSDSESRSINISRERKGRRCRRIVFNDFVGEHSYRQVIDFSTKEKYDTEPGMFSPYTTTHDSLRSVRMRERQFCEARVGPGAIPPVKAQPEIRVPDSRNVRESTTQFAQEGSLSQVWDLARATGIAKAIYLSCWVLLYEIYEDPSYEKLKNRASLSRIINQTIMPQLKMLFFFCILQANPSPVLFYL